jgi:serralysin
MGNISSNFSTTLDGVTTIAVGDDRCVWNDRKQLYDTVDILADLDGPTLTARVTLSGKAWFAHIIRTSHSIDAVINDLSTGATDDNRVAVQAIFVHGEGTNTIAVKNADVGLISGGLGTENISIGYWVDQVNTGSGDDNVSLVGSGEAGDIRLGRGDDVLKTENGLIDTVDAFRGSDTVLLGRGGASYINLGRDADVIKLSMLADKGQAVVLNGGEGVTASTDRDSDTIDFSAFSVKLSIDLNGQATVKSGHGNFFIRDFENAVGGSGKDVLIANAEANILKGNGGADMFVFETTKAAAGDKILDFSQSQKDKIDFGAIDASTKAAGDQDFTFIGTQGFHKKAGELRFEKKSGDTFIHGDVNSDGKADFSIVIDASINLKASDFIL